MKLYDICTKRTYVKDGVDKNIWLKVGTYKETDDNKKFIELNMFPSTSFYVFEQKPKAEVKETKEDIKWEE